MELDPWNALYRDKWATEEEYAGSDPTPALAAATALDPLQSERWIRRAIRAELEGRPAAAEQLYLQAARVNQRYSPRIALANFYFRQGNPDGFWKWVRLALERGYSDLQGAFVLCWQERPDAGWILEHAIPDDPFVLRQYLGFVVQQAGAPAAAPVARRLLAHPDPAGRQALLEYCETLIANRGYAEALEIWNALPERRQAGRSLLADPGFSAPPVQRGFGWRTTDSPEVTAVPGDPPGGIAFSFSGKQAERCDVLTQIVPLPHPATYRLAFEYRTEGGPDTGLSWHIENLSPAMQPLADAGLPPAEDWRAGQISLRAPGRFIRLVLLAARAPGTVRFEGRLWLRNLSLEEISNGR